jgi:hypothetical protein
MQATKIEFSPIDLGHGAGSLGNGNKSLVLCHSQNLACGKEVRSQLCEAPVGPFRQLTPDSVTTPIPKLDCDKALDLTKNNSAVIARRVA